MTADVHPVFHRLSFCLTYTIGTAGWMGVVVTLGSKPYRAIPMLPLSNLLAECSGLAAHSLVGAGTLTFSMLAIISAIVVKPGRWKRVEV